MAVTADVVDSAERTGMRPREAFEFFVLLPFGLGLFLGAARIGAQQFETVGHHMVYASLFSGLSWACYAVGCKVMSWLLRPWKPSLLVVLLTGNIVGGFTLWWPCRDVLNLAFEGFLVPGSSFGPFWPPPADGLGSYIAITLQGIAWWLLANWVDFRYRRVPRFGFSPTPVPVSDGNPTAAAPLATDPAGAPANAAPASTPASPPAATGGDPRLVARLPANLRGGEIWALEAEEHYTKIHTSKGNTLLLMRFSDAIAEMEPQPGLQVHRSFWVSRRAVERVARVEKRWVVQLRGGLEIPVSRSYRVTVQSAGLLGGSAMTED
ncbi:MAG: LytTR family transcriptional regulator [Chromatiales bacterium]|nr:LytTR family transcriptional regulator [Chromatiales bacterium]